MQQCLTHPRDPSTKKNERSNDDRNLFSKLLQQGFLDDSRKRPHAVEFYEQIETMIQTGSALSNDRHSLPVKGKTKHPEKILSKMASKLKLEVEAVMPPEAVKMSNSGPLSFKSKSAERSLANWGKHGSSTADLVISAGAAPGAARLFDVRGGKLSSPVVDVGRGSPGSSFEMEGAGALTRAYGLPSLASLVFSSSPSSADVEGASPFGDSSLLSLRKPTSLSPGTPLSGVKGRRMSQLMSLGSPASSLPPLKGESASPQEDGVAAIWRSQRRESLGMGGSGSLALPSALSRRSQGGTPTAHGSETSPGIWGVLDSGEPRDLTDLDLKSVPLARMWGTRSERAERGLSHKEDWGVPVPRTHGNRRGLEGQLSAGSGSFSDMNSAESDSSLPMKLMSLPIRRNGKTQLEPVGSSVSITEAELKEMRQSGPLREEGRQRRRSFQVDGDSPLKQRGKIGVNCLPPQRLSLPTPFPLSSYLLDISLIPLAKHTLNSYRLLPVSRFPPPSSRVRR